MPCSRPDCRCDASTLGHDLPGIKPQERARVLYWNGDDPVEEVERRIHAICEHFEIDGRELFSEGWLAYSRAGGMQKN